MTDFFFRSECVRGLNSEIITQCLVKVCIYYKQEKAYTNGVKIKLLQIHFRKLQ